MANNPQDHLFPLPRLPVSSKPLEGLGGLKAAMVLGMAGAGAAALFICAHWSIALVGGAVVLGLSAVENEPFLLFIVFLIPLSWVLSVGGHLHDVPTTVRNVAIVGFFLGRLWRGRLGGRRLLGSSLARASLLLLAAIVVSIIFVRGGWTPDSWSNLRAMGSYLGFFFLVSAWADSPLRVRKILSVVLYSTIITAVFAMLQEVIGGRTSFWLYLHPPDENFVEWQGRASSFMAHPNFLAGYLNLILPFALACYVLGRGKWKRLGGWTFGLAFLALLSAQSVGGLAAFVSIVVLAIFCFIPRGKKRLVLLAGLCTLVCTFYLLRSMLNPVHSAQTVGPDLLIRLLLWNTAWGYFIHAPVIGVGWGNFFDLYGSDLSSFSSLVPPGVFAVHNIYLQFLAETGIVGFLAFFYLILQSWRQAWSQWHSSVDPLDRALAFGVLGALISVLTHGFVDFFFQDSPQFGTLFWLLLALLVASGRLQSSCRGQGVSASVR